ncbi:hypothetical protein F2P79_021181 [Pimephales promelas]|nr:hypothetical protein F2P79_021181 [Pimephales promelas]
MLFGSPEAWMSAKWQDMLATELYSTNLLGIVDDEVHLTWPAGVSDETCGVCFLMFILAQLFCDYKLCLLTFNLTSELCVWVKIVCFLSAKGNCISMHYPAGRRAVAELAVCLSLRCPIRAERLQLTQSWVQRT